MTEIYIHFICAHYGLSGNAPVEGAFVLVPSEEGQRWAAVGLIRRAWAAESDPIGRQINLTQCAFMRPHALQIQPEIVQQTKSHGPCQPVCSKEIPFMTEIQIIRNLETMHD